jgi:hypothetical protein
MIELHWPIFNNPPNAEASPSGIGTGTINGDIDAPGAVGPGPEADPLSKSCKDED